jgi:hypothetical protein
MADSTQKRASRKSAIDKPKKPYYDFPLTPHNSGAWMKKIRGQIKYFGRWGRVCNGVMKCIPGDGWEEALKLYRAQAPDLHAGRTPRVTGTDSLTLAGLCNRFLISKAGRLQKG